MLEQIRRIRQHERLEVFIADGVFSLFHLVEAGELTEVKLPNRILNPSLIPLRMTHPSSPDYFSHSLNFLSAFASLPHVTFPRLPLNVPLPASRLPK